jgi:hypothetical protein
LLSFSAFDVRRLCISLRASMTHRPLRPWLALALLMIANRLAPTADSPIPLPEPPRPDFQREAWLNLNGSWEFRFDTENQGLSEQWSGGQTPFPATILVPFPWGSPWSGVPDQAPIAWYQRSVRAPEVWQGQRLPPGLEAGNDTVEVCPPGKLARLVPSQSQPGFVNQ